jgi:hypothetical protein
MRPHMKIFAFALVVALMALAGCGLSDRSSTADPRTVERCAKLHPPPPQMNVGRLGLFPVYFAHAAGSDDAASKQWLADMDACVAQSNPAAK